MGLEIEQERFDDAAYAHFAERLEESVEALALTLSRPGFGEGPASIGAELELFLVDRAGWPLPLNLEVLARSGDPRLTSELSRFTLELNLEPRALAGRPFAGLRRTIAAALESTGQTAAAEGGRVVAIGILPTLRKQDFGDAALTPLPRYRALANGIQRSRGGAPLRIAVAGEDTLNLLWPDVTFEGATTSYQVHLRVPPRRFADVYNAAVLATAPALALAANSPFFLGRRLWDETRVALFRQATDDRGELPPDWSPPARVSFGRGWMRQSALEQFAEAVALHAPLLPVLSDERPLEVARAGGVPALSELRLHNGTVWWWNRAVYDPADGGHLRLELRALPAGPTPLDMAANAAFLLGLTLALADRIEALLPGLPFMLARENFHRAARSSLDAELLWPTRVAPSPRPVPLRELLPRLFEAAARGLEGAGVERSDSEPLLEVLRARARAGINGARWQRRALEAQGAEIPREDALAHVLERYLELARTGRPVHEWPDR